MGHASIDGLDCVNFAAAANLVLVEGEFDVLNDGGPLLAGKVLGGLEDVAVQQGHLEGVGHARGLMRSPVGGQLSRVIKQQCRCAVASRI